MKRVLVVTYHFPPNRSAAGLRPMGLARYLPEYGWEPVILTPKLPARKPLEFEIVETSYRDLFSLPRKILHIDAQQDITPQIAQLKRRLHIRSERSAFDRLLTMLGEVAAYPDPQKGWRYPAIKAAASYLDKYPADAVISTSSYTSHRVAAELHRRCGVRWVADFQDAWTLNHYYPYSRIRRVLERRLEVRTVANASALVIVSEPKVQEMEALHQGKSVYIITNAFDPAEVNDPPVPLTGKFTITYTGNIYPGRQSPEPLFAALRRLTADGVLDAGGVEVRFYGMEKGWIEKQVGRYGLDKVVRQFGVVPRETALQKQRESQVLLMLKWNDAAEKGIYSSKLFEYLAARRPILAVGGYPDVVSDLLRETGAGVDAGTEENIVEALRQMLEEYRSNGSVTYRGDHGKADRYSCREMAQRYVEVLEGLRR